MDSKAFDYIRRIDALKAYDKDEHKFQENLQEIESLEIKGKTGKYIDADLYVEMQIYDDEHEEWKWWKGTIEELLDQWTEEGCPPTIDIVHCRECVYKGEINCPMYYRDRELKLTDFCSDGERINEK